MKINPKIVDLYHGDRIVDFAKAKAFGIRGIIHKATQGTRIADPAYASRRKSASAAGLLWGAYHFNSGEAPARQARHFIDRAEPDAAMLVALDFEDTRSNMSLDQARVFLDEVASALGRRPVLYSGNRIKDKLRGATPATRAFFAAHPLWLCEYAIAPRLHDADGAPLPWDKPFIWQFTGDGIGPQPHAIPGLQDHLDVNSFDGSDDDLAARWAA